MVELDIEQQGLARSPDQTLDPQQQTQDGMAQPVTPSSNTNLTADPYTLDTENPMWWNLASEHPNNFGFSP